MIDTHAHIFEEYYDNIDNLVNMLKQNNIIKVINCATSIKEIDEVVNLSNEYKDYLLPAIGIHPENILDIDNIRILEEKIKENRIIAIGEIGLDYHWNKDNKEMQKELFAKQLDLAEKYNLPVIIHTRDSIQDCFDMLKNRKLKGVIHCFNGSNEMALNFIKLGYKLGIGGVLTFKNSKLFMLIEKLDLKDIVLETDSPFLTPEPYRGKQNNPSNVYYVAKRISEIKNITIEDVIRKCNDNANDIFDIY